MTKSQIMKEKFLLETVQEIDNIKFKLLKFLEVSSEEDPRKIDDFLTAKEAAHYLNVSLPTLHRHTKNKLLKKYTLGGKKFYKKKELLNAIK